MTAPREGTDQAGDRSGGQQDRQRRAAITQGSAAGSEVVTAGYVASIQPNQPHQPQSVFAGHSASPRLGANTVLRMTSDLTRSAPSPTGVNLLSKVPEVTVYFWLIKVLGTTVGETAADFLNDTLGFGLAGTTLVMSVLLAAVLVGQFRADRYVPALYWSVVVLISVVGTLITDNLTDALGVPLELTTVVFAAALTITFVIWYGREGTLSIHSIVSRPREAWYWLAILFTFALGTAAGDLVAERFSLGYWLSAVIFGALIGAVAIAHYGLRLGAVLSFWIAYVLTRPLGASIGDFLSQSRDDGGLGLGTTGTSAAFLAAILALVTYLSVSRTDRLGSTE